MTARPRSYTEHFLAEAQVIMILHYPDNYSDLPSALYLVKKTRELADELIARMKERQS